MLVYPAICLHLAVCGRMHGQSQRPSIVETKKIRRAHGSWHFITGSKLPLVHSLGGDNSVREKTVNRISHIKRRVLGWCSNLRSPFANTFQSFQPLLPRTNQSLCVPSFLLRSPSLLLVCHFAGGYVARSHPDRPLTTVSAAQLEQRSPFHAISSSLVARADSIDPDLIPSEVRQTPMNHTITRR